MAIPGKDRTQVIYGVLATGTTSPTQPSPPTYLHARDIPLAFPPAHVLPSAAER